MRDIGRYQAATLANDGSGFESRVARPGRQFQDRITRP
jgi:hypothetical protein